MFGGLTANVLLPDAYDTAVEALDSGDATSAKENLRSLLSYAPSAAAYQGFAEASLATDDLPSATWAIRSAELLGGTSTLDQLKRRTYANLPSDLVPLPLDGVDGLAARTSRLPFPNLPSLLALLSLALLAVLLVRQLMYRRDRPFSAPWPALSLSLAFGTLCLWVASRQNDLVAGSEAVVVFAQRVTPDTAQLKSAPSHSAPDQRSIPAGAVVSAGETLSGYTEVVLPTGESGWLPTNRLWPIRPLAPAWPEERAVRGYPR